VGARKKKGLTRPQRPGAKDVEDWRCEENRRGGAQVEEKEKKGNVGGKKNRLTPRALGGTKRTEVFVSRKQPTTG